MMIDCCVVWHWWCCWCSRSQIPLILAYAFTTATLQQQQPILLARRDRQRKVSSLRPAQRLTECPVLRTKTGLFKRFYHTTSLITKSGIALPDRCRTREDTVADAKRGAEA